MKRFIARLLTFMKYRELFFQLVSRDIKLKYRRSVLGYLWSVLNPLFTMIIMVIVFSNLFARGIPNFPVYLLCGQMIFNFMSGATNRSLTSVISNAGLLKKVYVPKYIFTLATVTSELITFFFMMGALLIVIFATGDPLTWRFLFVIVPILQVYVFSIGLGLFLAQAAVFFRDTIHIWGVITTGWMFLSAIFYPVEILPEKIFNLVAKYNPMYFYIAMFRNFTMNVDTGNMELAIRGSIAAVIMLLLGFITFTKSKNKFILYM